MLVISVIRAFLKQAKLNAEKLRQFYKHGKIKRIEILLNILLIAVPEL